MGGFFRDFTRLIGRYRRGLFSSFLVACVLWMGALFTSYQLSTQSGFCDNCHFEEPYITSWEESSHADVDCHACHMPVGFGGKLDRSYQAIVSTWRYMWGSHDNLPRAEIDDQNCLQSGCHDDRLIQGTIEYEKGILFDHADHMGEEVRGMTLGCTSCHSQIVQGSHMEVTRETCYLCHFKNLPRGEAIAGCSCHGAPEDLVVHGGFEFKHAQYLTLGVRCQECHIDVAEGNGEVPRAICMTCHNARLEAYEDEAFIHRKHVEEHDVDCASCHESITHRDVKLVRSLETTCTGCHSGSHNPQRDMFMGIGALGVDPYPSVMFKAQVGCEGCHRGENTTGEVGERIATASGEACVMCHGRGFDNVLTGWKETVDDYNRAIGPLLKEAQGAYKRASAGSREPYREALERAEHNVKFIREGHGEHNLVYTKLVLVKVQEDLNSVLSGLNPGQATRTPLAFTEDDLRGNCTQSCHANLRKTKRVSFKGLELTHRDHVYKHNLECTYCHDNSIEHGYVKLERENCLACHHSQENRECSDCHKLQHSMFAGVGGFGVEETPSIMVDLDCSDCHADLHGGNNRAATLETCVECHEDGYEEFVVEWQSETDERVIVVDERLTDIRQLALTGRSRGITSDSIRVAEKYMTEALSHIEIVKGDRSRGVHNIEFVDLLLETAGKWLDRGESALTKP